MDLDYHRAYFQRNGTGKKIPLKQKLAKASAHMEGGEAATPGDFSHSVRLYDRNPTTPSYNQTNPTMLQTPTGDIYLGADPTPHIPYDPQKLRAQGDKVQMMKLLQSQI